MSTQQTGNTSVSNSSSIDRLLDDVEAQSQASESVNRSDESSSKGRRQVVDRRDRTPATPKGTVERRLEDDRRAKKQVLQRHREKNEQDRAEQKLQQHRKKILLAGCEPVMGLNYNSLAMDDYPDNTLVAEARRDRDSWVVVCAVFSLLFMVSLLGLLPPWLGGVGCGMAFLSAIFAFSPARKYFFSRPHLHDLLAKRKSIEYTALHHIQYLEGNDGLAWRCAKLSKFNGNLKKGLFSGLYRYSKNGSLLSYLHNKKTIRLYLLLMIEAQKAYKRLEKDYLEQHFKNLEQGWDDRIEEQEALKIEQSLNQAETKESKSLSS